MPQQPPKLGVLFLLTPLREGRQVAVYTAGCFDPISTHAPAGGATEIISGSYGWRKFLLTPLREGRRILLHFIIEQQHFYSRPCGRGDS